MPTPILLGVAWVGCGSMVLSGGSALEKQWGDGREAPSGVPVSRKLVIRGRASRCNQLWIRARRDQSATRGQASPDRKISLATSPEEGYPAIAGRNEHTS